MKFEYKQLEPLMYLSEAELNTHGAEGWELVTFVRCDDYVRYVFKREKP